MPPYQSTVRQKVTLGKEPTPGVAVTPDTEVPDLQFSLAADGASTQHAANGSIVDATSVANQEWAAGSGQGSLGYFNCDIVFDSLFGPNASGVWEPSATDPIAHQTYTVVDGTSTAAYQYAGVYVNGCGIEFSRKGVEIQNIELMGMSETPGASYPSSPTKLGVRPITPKTVSLYTAADWATLIAGGTKLAAGTSTGTGILASLNFSKLQDQVWALDDSLTSYAGTVEVKPDLTAKIVLAAKVSSGDYEGPLTLAKWRTNQIVFLGIKTSETIGGVAYSLHIFMALQLKTPPKRRDEQGLQVVEVDCTFVIDPTSGKWLRIERVNS